MSTMKSGHIKSFGYIILFMFLIGVGFSCKEDPTPTTPPTKSEMLVQNWRITSVTFNGQVSNSSQYSIKFQPNNSFVINSPGAVGLPQSGTWSLNSSETVVLLNNSIELPIRSLTQTSFILEYNYENHKEGNVVVLFTMAV